MFDRPNVDLYISGLSALLTGPEVDAKARHSPALQLWLTRAHRQQLEEPSLLKQFCYDLHIDSPADEFPLAALSYYFHTDVEAGYALYIDPVHLKPDRDHLVLFGPESVTLSLLEAQKLSAEIVSCYQELGWKIECCDANNWVLILDANPEVNFSPLADVIGKSIGDYLPTGSNNRYWRNISNEIQMLLHNHPTNISREQGGHSPVNSVWFWGGGSLQTLHKKKTLPESTCRVWTDDSCVAGLAKWADIDVRECPADTNIVLNGESHFNTEKIYLDLNHSNPFLAQSISRSQQYVFLEQQWIAPLMNALTSKKIQQLRLYDDCGHCFSIDYRLAKRWWKRVKPLSAFYVTAQ